ncbi:DUF1304 domain-containing protein [bacterium]|nr:DUF1304 domain-containing protein [bacterium]
MYILSSVLTGLLAVLQTYFMILEMFLWQKPKGLKVFGLTKEFAAQTAVLAANQGLYNGFLAAGLVWSLIAPDPGLAFQVRIFFLCCVLIAGIYGAMTANKRILFVQALPALFGLATCFLN